MSDITENERLAYLGLGSNVGDRDANLRHAIALLASEVHVLHTSSIYESDPVGVLNQGRFRNMVATIGTELPAPVLLRRLLAIEERMGRRRTFRNAPRNIDLDILLYGEEKLDEPGLVIPHPRMKERAFVLKPLLEIAPELTDPISGERYADVLARGSFEYTELVGPL